HRNYLTAVRLDFVTRPVLHSWIEVLVDLSTLHAMGDVCEAMQRSSFGLQPNYIGPIVNTCVIYQLRASHRLCEDCSIATHVLYLGSNQPQLLEVRIMPDLMIALLVIFVILTIVTLVGQGIWALLAAIF